MIWVQFTTGRGPGECQIACRRLVDIFIAEAEAVELIALLLDVEDGEHGWLSALVSLDGDDDWADRWAGTIQWTCVSPIRQGWKRKNWFIGVSVLRPPDAQSTVRESELRFQTFRASGPGGQHVQKTESAVRVTHLPTGITAQAQEERSQYRNKSLAVARLIESLTQRAAKATRAADQERWSKHNDLERGDPVRVYKGLAFIRM